MGKKSKRSRGGPVAGSKKSATSGTGTDTSNGLRLADTDALDADAMAKQAQALLEVPIPERLDGIISSNDADGFPPMTCMVCMVDFPVFDSGDIAPQYCCGKSVCDNCERLGKTFLPDMLGERRCLFCKNAKHSAFLSILQKEASSGKPWAQFMLRMNFISRKSPLRAFSWLLKAARGGNPAAFFKLSSMFMRPDSCSDLYPGFPSDIRVSGALLRRCKLFHSDYVRPCNKLLLDVVEDHGSFGALDDAKAILVHIANDADESTFDGQVDAKAAYLDKGRLPPSSTPGPFVRVKSIWVLGALSSSSILTWGSMPCRDFGFGRAAS